MKAFYLLMILCCACALPASAQERSLVRKGNELYAQKKYKEASDAYEKAQQKQPTFVPGVFNLGNALIQQKQYDAARKVMERAAKTSKDPTVQSGAHYNNGNTYMSEQQWQQAVDAYKQALRKNPQDADAKYNLSYALSKMKQDQQQKKQDQKKQQQNQDKQNQQQQQKDQQKKDGKNQQKQQGGGEEKNQQHQQQQGQQSKISEQQADNLLKAMQQEERKVQDKMQQTKAVPVKLEKDW